MQKVAHYRRVVWFNQGGESLSSILNNCLSGLPTDDLPKFSIDQSGFTFDCLVARRSVSADYVYLHIVLYEQGGTAAAIETAKAARALDALPVAPPDGADFIHAQLFCAIKGDHLVWFGHNNTLRANRVRLALASLIDEHNDGDGVTEFDVQAQLDPSAFKAAFDQGIQEIDLGVGGFKAGLEELIGEEKSWFKGQFESLVAKQPSATEIEAAANLRAKLVLTAGRNWDRPSMKELLSKMAGGVLDDAEDEFVIVTKSGLRLTKEKMAVSRPVDVTGTKQILSSIDAGTKLAEVMNYLSEAGLLEEDE